VGEVEEVVGEVEVEVEVEGDTADVEVDPELVVECDDVVDDVTLGGM
jgi:hypothetical protein